MRSHGTFLRFTHLTTFVVLCLIIFASSSFVKATDDLEACIFTNDTTDTTKKYFDLSPLKKTEGNWTVIGYGINWSFHINICNNVFLNDDDDDVSNKIDISIYGKDNENKEVKNLGKRSSTHMLFSGDKPVLEFVGSDSCSSSMNGKTKTYISLICDQTVKGQGQPIYVADFDRCGFLFEWKTPAACPTEPRGGWSVFFTIFVIALIVYFVGGVVYNRVVNNASGIYQIPNWEFWSNACDFIKDMILIILAQCPVFNKPRRSGGRNYRNLPRDDAENVLIEEEFEEH